MEVDAYSRYLTMFKNVRIISSFVGIIQQKAGYQVSTR